MSDPKAVFFFIFLLLWGGGVVWAEETPPETPPGPAGLPPLTTPPSGETRKWSAGILFGTYTPSLRTLNRVIGNPDIAILQDPNFLLPGNPLFPASQRNIVAPKIGSGIAFGAEIQRDVTKRFSLLIALSLWEGESEAHDIVPIVILPTIPLIFHPVPRSARYTVAIDQLWIGGRYHIVRDPEIGQFYLNIGLFGVALGQLNMDAVVKVVTPDITPFVIVSSTEAFGVGYTSRFGLGGDLYLTRWLSLGIQGNFIIGEVPQLKLRRHFPVGFPTPQPPEAQVVLPPPPQVGQALTFGAVRTINPSVTEEFPDPGEKLPLELFGFEVMGALRLYF